MATLIIPQQSALRVLRRQTMRRRRHPSIGKITRPGEVSGERVQALGHALGQAWLPLLLKPPLERSARIICAAESMLVLAGEKASGAFLIEQVRLAAATVNGVTICGAGHWLMQEAPELAMTELVRVISALATDKSYVSSVAV